MYGYAFCRNLRYRAESWHGVGNGPTRFESIQRSSRPKICPMAINFCEKKKPTEVKCIAGVKGHAGVNRGQPGVKFLRKPYGH